MPDFPGCPSCGATSIKVELTADGSCLTDLDSFRCTTCDNRWCTPRVHTASHHWGH
jgi:transposase-like protein